MVQLFHAWTSWGLVLGGLGAPFLTTWIHLESILGHLGACQELPRRCQAAARSCPGAARNCQELPRSCPGAVRSSSRAARSCPEAAQELPEAAQELPETLQELPESCQELHRSCQLLPGAARSCLEAAQELLRAVLSQDLLRAGQEVSFGSDRAQRSGARPRTPKGLPARSAELLQLCFLTSSLH